jgi:hypothetical protein
MDLVERQLRISVHQRVPCMIGRMQMMPKRAGQIVAASSSITHAASG